MPLSTTSPGGTGARSALAESCSARVGEGRTPRGGIVRRGVSRVAMATALCLASPAVAGEVLEVAMNASTAMSRSSANAFDAFGAAIAGNGSRILVGCRGCDLAGSNDGAVFAYAISADRRLVETQAILPNDPRLHGEFGHALALLGGTAAVGVPLGGVGGAVGILVEGGGTFAETQVVERSGGAGAEVDEFGSSVALGTGGRLAVGAPGAVVAGLEAAGLVEIHTLAGGAYGFTTTLTAPTPAEGERFGTAVALSGSWLAVGAPFDDGAGEDAGAVHLFRRLPTGEWTFASTLRPPGGEVIGAFGRRLAFDGDSLVVGAPRLDSAGPDRGAVFMYKRVASLWVEEAILTPPGSPAGTDFGDGLALEGDLLLVGAPSDGDEGVGTGAAYVYERDTFGWSPIVRLESVATGYSFLGTAVGLADGMVAVGAPLDSSTANYAGSGFQLDLVTDCDGSGVADVLETAADPTLDIDGDGVLDACEPDCDGDGLPDDYEILIGSADDLNGNGTPDECEVGTVVRVPTDHPTIGSAIDASVDGWIVEVEPGTYAEAIDFGTRAITIRSTAGRTVTTIDANGAPTAVRIAAPVPPPGVGAALLPRLEGFTITGGAGGTDVAGLGPGGGGVLLVETAADVVDCVVEGNTAGTGGGVLAIGGAPRLVDCIVRGNVATGDGGGLRIVGGTASFEDGEIADNTAGGGGGGVARSASSTGTTGTATIDRTLFSANLASDSGAAVANAAGAGTLTLDTVLACGSGEDPIDGEVVEIDVVVATACTDCDANGRVDRFELLLGEVEDLDGDLVIDPCDNCPNLANAAQADCDGDGVGDACAVAGLDPESQTIAFEGGSVAVEVLAAGGACGWTAVSNDDWIVVLEDGTGSGGGTALLLVESNEVAAARTGSATIAGFEISIEQAAAPCGVVALDPASASFGAAGGSGTFSLTTNGAACGWTATTAASWIAITSGGTGAGADGTVAYSVDANPLAVPRSATISVGGESHMVGQQAAACAVLGFGASSSSVAAAGGPGSVDILTNGPTCSWSAVSDATWLSIVSGGSGTGEAGVVEYLAEENTAATGRTATITAGGATHTVVQQGAGCAVTGFSSSGANVAASGGSGSFELSTNGAGCGWTAVSSSPWLTIASGGSGTGTSGTVEFVVAANTLAAARTATITAEDQVFTVVQDAAACVITGISSASANFNASGGDGSFLVFTNGGACGWNAVSSAAWLVVTGGETGNGTSGQIAYSVAANPIATPRTATISVGDEIHTVTQEAAACVVVGFDPPSASVPSSGGEGTISISTNGESCGWTAVSSAGWLSIVSGGSGTGTGGTIVYVVEPNPIAAARTATIVAGGAVFQVEQAAGACEVTGFGSTSSAFGASGGSGSFTISTNGASCGWTATSGAGWVSITAGESGSGTSGLIAFSVAANPIAAPRTTTIVAGDEIHTITQEAAACVVVGFDPPSASVPSSGGEGTISISTNGESCGWTAVSSAGWLSIVSGGSGTGTGGTIVYSVAANEGSTSRTATITAGNATFSVFQPGLGCAVTSISSDAASFGLAGGNGGFDLTTNGAECEWTAVSSAGWLSIVSGGSGSGVEGTIAYSVAANASADPRTATIAVGGFVHTVSQAASPCVILGFTPESASVPATGGVGTTAIATNGDACSWSAVSSAGWLSIVSGGEGSGPAGTIEYAVAANTVATPRTATITAGGATFILTQAAAPCEVLSIDPAESAFEASGGVGSVALATNGPNCTWSAISDVPWVVVTSGGTGTGTSGVVQYFVTANPVAAARTGTLTIGGVVHTVVQQGPPCEVSSIDPASANLPSAGGLGAFEVETNGPDCGYAAVSEAAWVVITAGGSGAGSGTVEYEVLANAQAEPREAAILVGSASHLVVQEAAPCVVVGVTPAEASIGAAGGLGEFMVKVNGPACPWSATTAASWIELIASEGIGGGAVAFEVAANDSTLERSGVVEVGDAVFLLTQAGQPCEIVAIDPVEASFPSAGGTGGFVVATNGSNCTWEAIADVPWIEVSLGGGEGSDGVVEYTVLANDGVSQRLGSIEVGGLSHTVIQAGGDDCNANGVPDAEEIASGDAADCNGNQIPDECDVASGTSSDFNGNGIPDECENDRIVGVPDEFPTIQDAIEGSLPGWTIRVAPGLYEERIDFAGRAVTIESITGPASTRIDGTGLGGTVVSMVFGEGLAGDAAPVLRGFTIRGGTVGTALPGTGLLGGGGLVAIGADASIENCVFVENTANVGGGAAILGGAPTFVDCRFEGNLAATDGGGVWMAESGAAFESCRFVANVADARGGGVRASGGDATFFDVEFRSNDAELAGGGLAWFGAGSITLSSSLVTENTAPVGAGLWSEAGVSTLELFETEVCGNEPDQIAGDFTDLGGNVLCLCAPDVNGDGQVNGADLAEVLGSWGICDGPCDATDINGDGQVNGADLAELLGSWGDCGG